jgi:predicted naringenin-chalcone synthase
MTNSANRNYSYINAIGTAVPPYEINQRKVADFFSQQLGLEASQAHELNVLHRASGIQTRYSVLPDFQEGLKSDFFKINNFPKVSDRMLIYRQQAPPLAKTAILNCLEQCKHTTLNDITHLITVSCTGMYAPGLDIELVEELGMPYNVQRTAINFMGCYGAFNGLKTADQICRADTDAKVLIVCVELCSIHFQDSKLPDDLLSCTLFADGAAAVLVTGQPQNNKASLKLNSF